MGTVASRQSAGSGCSASSRSALHLLFDLFGRLTYWKSEDIRHPQKVLTPRREK